MWQAEQACSQHEGDHANQACVSDVLAMNDLEVASKIPYSADV